VAAQYSFSIYMWDILLFWNCITCHSMYNILFQYTCEAYWCSETISHVTPCTISNCDVSRPHTTALSITMLSNSHVPYNQYIITANNVHISCKINSCLLPHWCSDIYEHHLQWEMFRKHRCKYRSYISKFQPTG